MSQRVQNVISQQGNDLSELVNRYAEVEQCPAVGLLAGLISESNLNEHAERIGTWPDWSEGLGQQTVLYAAVGDHTATMTNLKVVRDYYWQAENAIRAAAALYGAYYEQYGDHFEAWSRYNGGPMMAWTDNPNQANIRRGWNAAQLYLAPDQEAPPMTYDPDTPSEFQLQDWTCSVRSATWCLRSLGIDVTAGEMQTQMQAAGLVTPADGLLDGSGTSLARWLAETFGVPATAVYPADWAAVTGDAGTGPIALGGMALNHWLAVRRPIQDANALDVMNPAPNWHGIGTELSKTEWDTWGPWSAIYVAVPSENGGDDSMTDSQRAILSDEVLRNIDKALAVPRLPRAAREALAAGARPACETLIRGEG